MVETDRRIVDLLDRLQPPVLGTERNWDLVVARAGRVRGGRPGLARLLARRGRVGTRGLLIAVAVGVIGVGAATAAGELGLFGGGGSLFDRHYPVRHLRAQVVFEHGPAPAWVGRLIGDGSAWNLPASGEAVDGRRTRFLGSVALQHRRYRYFAVPMTGRRGYCVFGEDMKPGLGGPHQFCTHWSPHATPWVNQAPPLSYRIPERFAQSGADSNHSSLLARVGEPISGFNGRIPAEFLRRLHEDTRPVAVWTVTGMAPRAARRVDIRFQDGTSMAASLNRPFFFAVIQGEHARLGHRPVGILALDGDGRRLARQPLIPGAFDIEQYALQQAVVADKFAIDEIAANESGVISGHGNTPYRMWITTRDRVARVFGGPPSAYPETTAVIVFDGPFTVATPRHRCGSLPAQCTLPAGRYAWLALAMPANVIRAVRGDELAHAYRHWQRVIRWIALPPAGTAKPDFAPLGEWTWSGR
jgi:hypothetical protein